MGIDEARKASVRSCSQASRRMPSRWGAGWPRSTSRYRAAAAEAGIDWTKLMGAAGSRTLS